MTEMSEDVRMRGEDVRMRGDGKLPYDPEEVSHTFGALAVEREHVPSEIEAVFSQSSSLDREINGGIRREHLRKIRIGRKYYALRQEGSYCEITVGNAIVRANTPEKLEELGKKGLQELLANSNLGVIYVH